MVRKAFATLGRPSWTLPVQVPAITKHKQFGIQLTAMKTSFLIVLLTLFCLAGCNKSKNATPTSAASGASSSASPSAGPVQQKLQEYAGSGATNCGSFDVRSAAPDLKTASDCSMQASQGKKPFYISYDMPGMSVGVAGNSEGKLFTVQAQGGAAGAALTSGACPSALRVASSGRVTCFAPGDMGSMSGSHTAGSMPSGTPNPHTKSAGTAPNNK
jgi:hypothetical protein